MAAEHTLLPRLALDLAPLDPVEPMRDHPAASQSASVEAVLIPDTIAAALCGISRAHLHRLRSAGKWGPEAVRLGRKLLFNRESVIAWARAGCPDGATWRAMQAAAGRRSARVVG